MRIYSIASLASLLLASCVNVDSEVGEIYAKAFVERLETFGPLGAAAAEYRDRNGTWPVSPTDLEPLLTDHAIDVDRLEQHVEFRTTPRGLAVIDRETKKTAIIIANESTGEKPVLTTRE